MADSFSPDLSQYAKLSDVAAGIQTMLGDTPPLGEAGLPAAGSAGKATRTDHRHPRLSSSQSGTLDANGTATIVFTRTFPSAPGLAITAVENNTNAVPRFKVKSWTIDGGGLYTGCVIYADRAIPLPTIAPLSGALVLLSGVITGVNTLVTALSGFVPYQPAANMPFVLVAIAPSTTGT